MTVSELIKQLEALSPSAVVVFYDDYEDEWTELEPWGVRSPYPEKVYIG